MSSGLANDTRDVTWDVERVVIIAAESDTGPAAVSEAWDADLYVRYVQGVS